MLIFLILFWCSKIVFEPMEEKDNSQDILQLLWEKIPNISSWNNQIETNLSEEDLSISQIIEQTIEEKENCNRVGEWEEKMFVSFAILWTGENDSDNIEYYLLTSWEWMIIDHRWNLNPTCGFSWIPTKIELKQTQTWFDIIDYQIAMGGSLYVSSTKELFSPEAFQKRQDKNYKYNTNLSPLQRAEEYFDMIFFTWWNFECEFCNKNRYEYGYADEKQIKDRILESYTIFKTIPNDNNNLIFYSDWIFENNGGWDQWTGNRIFGQNEKTILVNSDPYHTYDRYIIRYFSEDEMHLIREIIHK